MNTALTCAALLALAGPSAEAGSFDYVSRSSRIQIFGELPGAPPPQDYFYASRSTLGFGLFERTLDDQISWAGLSAGSTASQTSSLAATSFNATGWTYMQILSEDGSGTGSVWARSAFDVVFDLTQAAPVELSGAVHTPPGQGPPSYITCALTLWRQIGAGEVGLYEVLYESPVEYAAILAAGRYRLSAEAYIAGDTDAGELPICGSTYFDLVMQIVPEPSTLALLLPTLLILRRCVQGPSYRNCLRLS